MAYPISDVTRRVVYSGSAGVGPYSFSFEILTENDIAVYENDTLLTITTDYSVTINADGTGSVTLVSASTASDTVAILGNKGIARTTDFVTGGDLFATSLNDELDAQTIFAQQNAEAISRAIKIPPQSSLSIDTTLPVPQANYVLGWDDAGTAILNLQELGNYQGTDATTTTANYNNRDIVKDSSTNNVYICLQASTAGTLLTNTSYWALLVDAAAAATSASAAASSATAAASSATAAASSATAAAASESAAGTSETNAASSASSASTSASSASTSATNAATSATAAAGSATTAASEASDAATSATAAAGSATSAASSATTATTQASAASTSATNAASSASAASTSASNASTSASNAATSATAAASSATSAAASATSAQAALDSIENFYLGASATAPTVDDNGDPLAAGDWYFNTTDNLTYIYNGSSWQVTVVSTSGLLQASNNLSDLADASTARTNLGLAIGTDVLAYDATVVYDADIGVTIQAYDADTAKTDVTQNFTAPQRSADTVDNDGSFDLSAAQNFTCTPTGAITLTFTNIPDGQSGFILLVNTTPQTVSLHANTKGDANLATTLSTAGTYLVSYYANGTNVYLTTSGAIA